MKKPYIHVYYGNGKGKTSAATGLCIRAIGANKRILFAQFLKNGNSHEIKPLKDLGIDVYATREVSKFYFQMTAVEKEAYTQNQQTLFAQISKAITTQNYDIVVLDELLDAVSLNLIPAEDVQKLLSLASMVQDIIFTGRDPSGLLDLADYATHMQSAKHPYEHGVTAREGIEY